MTTIFDSTRPVKSTRFGSGILRSVPTHRKPYTAEDERWAAQAFNADTTDYDVLAAEAVALDRLTAGHLL